MVTSINDIIRAMRQDPNLRDELRREILTEELLAMPQRLSDLAAVVDAQGQRISDLAAVVDAHGRQIADLTVAVEAHGRQIADLTVAVEANGRQIANLVTVTERQSRDISDLKGQMIELIIQGRILAFLSSRLNLRRATVVRGPALSRVAHDFEDVVEDASDKGEITSNQRERVYDTDVIVRARRRQSGETVYVAVEASFTVDYNDVDRAANSAIALRQVFPGMDVVPAVYGEAITQGGASLAKGSGVSVFLRDPEPESSEQSS